jgi:hypothetical protein
MKANGVGTASREYSWDVTDQVLDWLEPMANNGWPL